MVLRPGDTLREGQYKIQSILGQGGFGVTYKAWDQNLKRPVVLKSQNEYLQYDPDYEKYVARFIKEGQIMAKLAEREMHPNLVKVFDLFSEPVNHYYLVMEFIEGQNLFETVKSRSRLPEIEVISIAKDIGSALQWMHDHCLVHRDVHPGNIMLRLDGKAVLIDLGGAKEIVPSSQSSKGIIGNQGFAPYEQIVNPKDARHPSADIFGLAGSLYFAVTGERPTESLARKLNNASLVPPQQRVTVSKDLNAMLMAGLALEADDRPQSATKFLQILTGKNQRPVRSAENSPPPSTLAQNVEASSVPWGWLLGCVITYTIIGIGVSVQPSSQINWTVALAVPVVGVKALSVLRAMTAVVVGAGTWPVAVTLAVAWAVAMVGAVAAVRAVSILSLVISFGTVAGVVVGLVAGAVVGFSVVVGARTEALARAEALAEPVARSRARANVVTRAKALAWAGVFAGAWAGAGGVAGIGVGLFYGSWNFIGSYGLVLAWLWYGSWPLTLGLIPGVTASRIPSRQSFAVVLPALAAWVGLAIGWFIYRIVHPV
jgi:tRNA A-37 threonylcarbamoyl transferase component Bud32